MAQCTGATGATAELTVSAPSFILRAMYIQAVGLMIKQTEKENIHTAMERHMKESGKMMCNMGRERRFGLMERAIRDSTAMARSTARALTYGATGHATQVIGRTTIFLEKASIHGVMGRSTGESGATTTCTASAFTCGPEAARTSAFTCMTRRKGMGSTCGAATESSAGGGIRTNSMDWESTKNSIVFLLVIIGGMKYGLWENGKRIRWFTQGEVEKIKAQAIDYTELFEQHKSKLEIPKGLDFDPPSDFEILIETVLKEFPELSKVEST
eukprot:TRINITY_DN12069_c0_g1_i10.p1 TRINITY_DN12069_c0_g1~~TRINITY_DN12069_c0_g1_i10.p1  ORF type:complete len:270 (-),score=34.57 TRINITY_DN12069_c0_g1_i10:163-972(-)